MEGVEQVLVQDEGETQDSICMQRDEHGCIHRKIDARDGMISGSTYAKRSLNEATPPPRGASSSLSCCSRGTGDRSGLVNGDLRAAGIGTGRNSGDTAGEGFGIFAERDGGGGGGGRFCPELKSV